MSFKFIKLKASNIKHSTTKKNNKEKKKKYNFVVSYKWGRQYCSIHAIICLNIWSEHCGHRKAEWYDHAKMLSLYTVAILQ